jgi:hypothetical protein
MKMAPEGHCVIQLFFVKTLWEQGRQAFKYTQDNGWKTVQTESEGPSQQLPEKNVGGATPSGNEPCPAISSENEGFPFS